MNIKIRPICLILPLVMLLAVACNPSPEATNQPAKPQSNVAAIATSTSIATILNTKWQTYADTNYGFELQYPEDWKNGIVGSSDFEFCKKSAGSNCDNGQSSLVRVFVKQNPKMLSLLNFAQSESFSIDNPVISTINGNSVLQTKDSILGLTAFFITKGSLVVILTPLSTSTEGISAVQNMVDSLKFTK